MKKNSLSILMRARMSALPAEQLQQQQLRRRPPRAVPHQASQPMADSNSSSSSSDVQSVSLKDVKEWMHASITIPNDKLEAIDENLEDFLKGYLVLSEENRRELLLVLAKDYDVKRERVFDLVRQYLSIELPNGIDIERFGEQQVAALEKVSTLAAFYRMEKNLRDALKPMYAGLFERLNAYPGGLKLLAVLRADLLSVLAKENSPSLRALDSYLKEKLITWLSPASLELHQITWDDSASLLEKIVAYEAVHPIRNLLDLKRRLSEGRRCFAYLHPAIPGEPLIFIEVALLKEIASSIQDVLWDIPPAREIEATCALFYSISSTQPGLSGINLGKFLIKRVVNLIRRDMPHVKTFATLSPIPGYMNWLLSKLASQIRLANSAGDQKSLSDEASSSTLHEDILLPEEKEMILSGYISWIQSDVMPSASGNIDSLRQDISGKNALEIMYEVLKSREWSKSVSLREALRPPLLRLCARYLIKEKKRGKALDSVANFHLQNGAMVERINWMADQSEKGIEQSGGIMVNYVYRLDQIDENAQLYLSTGNIRASNALYEYLEKKNASL